MRLRNITLISFATLLTLTLAGSPTVAQKNIDVAPSTGDRDTYRASLMAGLEDRSKIRGNASPWALRAAALRESAATGVKCQPVRGHTDEGTFLDRCVYQGHEYAWCVDVIVWGTLTGTYHYYGNPETEYALAVPPGALGENWLFGATSALAVFETKKGEIFAQENVLFHYDAPSSLVELLVITGGTGHYEGATGWMSLITDFGYPQGSAPDLFTILTGVICTPSE